MKACKQCKTLTESTTCPNCKSNNLTSGIKGKIFVLDAEKSEIAQKMEIKKKGEYAIKVA